jgi:hypothetical protein
MRRHPKAGRQGPVWWHADMTSSDKLVPEGKSTIRHVEGHVFGHAKAMPLGMKTVMPSTMPKGMPKTMPFTMPKGMPFAITTWLIHLIYQ